MYTFGTFVLYIFDVQIDGYSHLLLSKFAKVLKNYAFANELPIYIVFLKYTFNFLIINHSTQTWYEQFSAPVFTSSWMAARYQVKLYYICRRSAPGQ